MRARERALAPLRPPTTPKSRGRDGSELHGTIHLQSEQRRPHRDPAHEVDRAVDRVDEPTASPAPGAPHLFTKDRISWPFAGDQLTDRGLGRPVGFSDRGRVSFGLDRERRSPEGRKGDPVGQVNGLEGQF